MRPKLEPWQRNQYVLALTVATVFLGLDFSQPLLPLYVRYLGIEDVGEAALWSGLIVGVAPLCSALTGPAWGYVADRYGQKLLVMRALAAIILTCILLGLAPNVQVAFVGRLLMGLFAGFSTMAMALAVSSGPRDRMGRAIGLLQAAQTLPMAVGPPLGGFVSDRFGLRANFFITAGVVAVSAGLLFKLFEESPAAPAEVRKGSREPDAGGSARQVGLTWLLGVPGFAAALAISFVGQFAERSLPPVLPLYLVRIATPPDQLATLTGLITAAGAITTALSATLYGRLARPETTRRLLMLALVGGAACVGPIALVGQWHEVLGLRLLLGLAVGGCTSLAYALGTRGAPPGRTGVAMGVLSSSSLLAGGIAPFVAGLVGRFDLQAVFWIDAGLYLAALGISARLPRAAGTGPGPARTPS